MPPCLCLQEFCEHFGSREGARKIGEAVAAQWPSMDDTSTRLAARRGAARRRKLSAMALHVAARSVLAPDVDAPPMRGPLRPLSAGGSGGARQLPALARPGTASAVASSSPAATSQRGVYARFLAFDPSFGSHISRFNMRRDDSRVRPPCASGECAICKKERLLAGRDPEREARQQALPPLSD